MIPLRIAGIMANFAFIAYGAWGNVYPVLVLHAMLLPLNVARLWQMVALVRAVRDASTSDVSIDALKPFMTSRVCASGHVLFRKGEVADAMYYIFLRLVSQRLFEDVARLEQGRSAVERRSRTEGLDNR